MEYIKGKTFSKNILYGTLEDNLKLTDKLTDYINLNLINKNEIINNQIIREKIFSINDKLYLPPEILNWLEINIDEIKIPIGYCHGDLTMENIIIADNQIYFIDFLDSYIDSPFQDIAKLFQDIYGLWSFRNEPNINYLLRIRLDNVKKRIVENLNLNCEKLKAIDTLTIVNFLRILPYANNKLKGNLLKNINKIINQWN